MSDQKFKVPTETIELPSKGLVYPKDSELSKGEIEIKYMTAREEDILTNVNNLRNGTAIEKTLKSLIKSNINYDDLLLGDRNGILIASRILAYGKDYQVKYTNPSTGEEEVVTCDLQSLKYKEINPTLYTSKNDFSFELPFSKNVVTFKLLTIADDKRIDEEAKGLKKATGLEAGSSSLRLKHQITSINGDYNIKVVRDFVDNGLLARDSMELRKYIQSVTPDIESKIFVTLSTGEDVEIDMPITAEFFFPGSGV
jgi:hypothetical protein